MPPHNDVETFHEVLRSSRRILALCGAGLSASSGLPTFRGAGGLWRMHSATKLATMRAFTTDPGLVWLFYGYRRHLALQAKPNPGHQALAALAKKNPDFLCLTQNVDSEFFNRPYLEREWAPALWGQLSTSKMFRGWTNARPFAPWSLSVDLSQRANHPPEQLCTLHGSLFDIKCTTEGCGWIQRDNFDDPFCPSLKAASEDPPPGESLPLLDPYHRIKHVPEEELPKCPKCQTGIQRPGVVWFGEELDENMLDHIDEWITKDKIDLMLVIGTSAQVYPAAGYISEAQLQGARICTINIDAEEESELYKIQPGDFAFGQDAAEALPRLLEPLIGTLQENGEFSK